MVENVSMLIRADVSIQQPKLVAFDQPVGILQVGESSANGLDLRTRQRHAALKFFQQEVVMRGVPINGSISLSRGGRVAVWGFLRVRLGLMCGLARHGVRKLYLSSRA